MPTPKARSAKRDAAKRPPTYSDLVILFFLFEGEPYSGYSMKRVLTASRINEWLPVSNMTVYQSLKRLEEKHLVTARTEQQDNYPERVLYQITDSGRDYFAQWQAHAMQTPQRDFFHFDIGLGLSSFTTSAERVAAAEARIDQLRLRLLQVQQNLETYGDSYHSPFPRWLLLDHERDYLINEIKWLRRFIRLTHRQPVEEPDLNV